MAAFFAPKDQTGGAEEGRIFFFSEKIFSVSLVLLLDLSCFSAGCFKFQGA
jgi:hypothetical protein